MILNDLGKIAGECWRAIPEHFPFVETGACVIMPNHVHGIIVINHNVGATHAKFTSIWRTTAFIGCNCGIGSFKSAVPKRIGREHNATGIGQRNYYERIIRDEKDLKNKTDYIHANPSLGDEDDNNPKNVHNN